VALRTYGIFIGQEGPTTSAADQSSYANFHSRNDPQEDASVSINANNNRLAGPTGLWPDSLLRVRILPYQIFNDPKI